MTTTRYQAYLADWAYAEEIGIKWAMSYDEWVQAVDQGAAMSDEVGHQQHVGLVRLLAADVVLVASQVLGRWSEQLDGLHTWLDPRRKAV